MQQGHCQGQRSQCTTDYNVVPVTSQMKRNVHRFSHPGMGIHTLQELSLLKEESLEAVLTTIRHNTTQLYGI